MYAESAPLSNAAAHPRQPTPAAQARRLQRNRWLWRITFGMVGAFCALLFYLLLQLLALQKQLAEDIGEDMLWALAQAERHTLLLERSLQQYHAGNIDREELELRHDLFQSRIDILLDGPQQRALRAVESSVELLILLDHPPSIPMERVPGNAQANQALNEASSALLHLATQLHQMGNALTVQERYTVGEQRDRQSRLMRGILIVALALTGSASFLIVQLVRSVRAQKRSAQQIAQQHQKLQQSMAQLESAHDANARYRNFVSLISHQFRTPLSVIDFSAQRLHRSVQRQPQTTIDVQTAQTLRSLVLERTELIRHTTARMNQLINSVLTSLQLEDGLLTLTRQPCNLLHLAETARQQALIHHPLREILIYTHFYPHLSAPTAPPAPQQNDAQAFALIADSTLMENLILNLLDNACKYSPPGSPIGIHLHVEEGYFQLRVRDHGTSLPESELPRLFERFQRGRNTAGADGTGLGLHIARAIAELHGGQLQAANAMPHGLVFTLTLPSAPAAEAPQ